MKENSTSSQGISLTNAERLEMAVDALEAGLDIGTNIPVIGSVCHLVKEIVSGLKKVHYLLKDICEIEEKMIFILDYLENKLPNLLDYFEDDPVQIVVKIGNLVQVLSKFKEEIVYLGKCGVISRWFEGGKYAWKLEQLNHDIDIALSEIDRLVSNETNITVLSQLKKLSSKVGYLTASNRPLDEKMNAVYVKKRLEHDSLNQKELLGQLLEDEDVQILSQNSYGIDVTKVSATELIKHRLVGETAAAVTGRGGGGSIPTSYNMREHRETALCISIHPAPYLITSINNADEDDDILHHKGLSFDKRYLTCLLTDIIEKKGLSASMPSDDALSDSLLQSQVLLYLGQGMGYENTGAGKVVRNADLLLNCEKLPRIVFICMKYGAKGFSDRLSKATNAVNIHSIFWMEPIPQNLNGSCMVILNFLKTIIEEGSVTTENLRLGLYRLCGNSTPCRFGFIPGRAHDNTVLFPRQVVETNKGFVVSESKLDLVPNNIFDHLKNGVLNSSELGVLSVDKATVGITHEMVFTKQAKALSIRCPSYSFNGESSLIDEQDSNENINDKHEENSTKLKLFHRHRSVAFEVAKRSIFMFSFGIVLHITTSKQIKQLVDCIESRNFTMFGISEVLNPSMFVWIDVKSDDVQQPKYIDRLLRNPLCQLLFVVDQGALPAFVENDKRIRKMDLPECDSETLNTLASDHHDEIVLDLIPKDKDSLVKIDCTGFASALQEVLCDGIDVVAVYDGDDNQLFARLSIADVKSLQNLFGLILIDTFGATLREKLSASQVLLVSEVEDIDDDWSISVNLSYFAELFLNSMFSLDNLTPLQSEVLATCKTIQRVHIKAPAGCGKTFVALQKMKQMITRKVKVLFIARNKSLCLHVAQWLLHRLGKDNIENYLFVSFEPFGNSSMKQVRRISVSGDASSSIELIDHTFDIGWFWSPLTWFYLVIDEAHHLYTSEAPLRSTLISSYREPSLLHDILAPYKHLAGLMMLSDSSQSTVFTNIDSDFRCTNIDLKEVVRSSQKIMCGARCFATGDYDVQCHHDMQGSALQVQIFPVFSPQTSKYGTILKQLYLSEVVKAIQFYLEKFKKFKFSGRIAIVVDANYLDMKEQFELEANRANAMNNDYPQIALLTTHEKRDLGPSVERFVFDTIDNLDGLEFLFVITVGLDRLVSEGNKARSRIYRSITRAQMMFTIVNHYLPGGWLEFLLNVKLSSLFEGLDAAEERFKVKPDAVKKALSATSPQCSMDLNRDSEVSANETQPATIPPLTSSDILASSPSLVKNPLSATSPQCSIDLNRDSVVSANETQPASIPPLSSSGILASSPSLSLPSSPESSISSELLPVESSSSSTTTTTVSPLVSNSVQPLHSLTQLTSESMGALSTYNNTKISHFESPVWDNSPSTVEPHFELNSNPLFMPLRDDQAVDQVKLEKRLLTACSRSDAKSLMQLKELAALGVNVNCTDEESGHCSPAFIAANSNSAKTLILLAEVGADFDISCTMSSPQGQTPLQVAESKGFDNCVNIINLANKLKDFDQDTLIHKAVNYPYGKGIEHLIQCNVNLEEIDKDGNTPLRIAAMRGHSNIVSQLLEAGANKDAVDKDGSTVVMIAVETECLKLLIEAKAQLNLQNNDGKTAVMYTAENDQTECLKLLIEAKAELNLQTNDGKTAVMYTVENDQTECLKLLIEAKAELNLQTNDGTTGVMFARQTECLKLLIEAKAQLNLQNNDGKTAVMIAADYGKFECLKLLMEAKADLNLQTNGGKTAVMFAAQCRKPECLKLLIEAKAQLNLQNHDGKTAIMLAVLCGKTECLKLLIEAKAELNLQTNDGITALMLAVLCGKTKCLKLLMEAKAQLNLQDNDGKTAVMIAADYGKFECLKLLMEAKADLNLHNNDGKTAVMITAQNDETECFKLLIEGKAQLNIQRNYDGWTAVMFAVLCGKTECLKLLIEAKTQLNLQTNDGKTAVMLAARYGQTECLKLLMKAKVRLNLQDNNGKTAVMLAAQNGRTESLELLFKAKSELNLQTNDGKTAVMLAARYGQTECLKLLFEAEAQLNLQDKEAGKTAAIIAAENDQTECLKLLIEAKAQLNLQTNDGKTAVMYAAENDQTEYLKLLIEAKAELNIQRNYNGWTAVMIAALFGKTECLKLLIEANAQLNIQDNDGKTTVMYAAENDQTECLKLLIEAKAQLNLQNNDGKTAAMYAAENCKIECLKLLIEAKAQLNLRNKHDATVVMLAARYGQTECLKLLIKAKAQLNLQDNNGSTAVMFALVNSQTECLKLLIEAKADLNLQHRSNDGTAVMFAAEEDKTECLKLLIEAKADLNLQDKCGRTALKIAQYNGHSECERLLVQAGAVKLSPSSS